MHQAWFTPGVSGLVHTGCIRPAALNRLQSLFQIGRFAHCVHAQANQLQVNLATQRLLICKPRLQHKTPPLRAWPPTTRDASGVSLAPGFPTGRAADGRIAH